MYECTKVPNVKDFKTLTSNKQGQRAQKGIIKITSLASLAIYVGLFCETRLLNKNSYSHVNK